MSIKHNCTINWCYATKKPLFFVLMISYSKEHDGGRPKFRQVYLQQPQLPSLLQIWFSKDVVWEPWWNAPYMWELQEGFLGDDGSQLHGSVDRKILNDPFNFWQVVMQWDPRTSCDLQMSPLQIWEICLFQIAKNTTSCDEIVVP